MDATDIPGTDEERQEAMLGFSAVLGGGVIAYFAASAIRDGDLFKVDDFEGKPTVGFVALGMGLGFLGLSVSAAAETVGWKPLIYGSLGITGAALLARAVRR
jgi:hypothetical protein